MPQDGFYQPDFGNVNIPDYNITAQQNQSGANNPLQFNQNGPFRNFLGNFLRNFRRNRPRLFNRGFNDQGQPLGVFGNPYGPPVAQQQPVQPQQAVGVAASSGSYVDNLPRTQSASQSLHPSLQYRQQPTREGSAYSWVNPRTGMTHNYFPNQQTAPQGYEFSNFDLGGGSVFRPQARQLARPQQKAQGGPLSYLNGLQRPGISKSRGLR